MKLQNTIAVFLSALMLGLSIPPELIHAEETPAQFMMGEDNWSFVDTGSNFRNGGTGTYYMKDSYREKLFEGLSEQEASRLEQFISTKEKYWAGLNYGMAVTAILASQGILKPSDFQSNAQSLYDITAPVNEDVESLITYYYYLQRTTPVLQAMAELMEYDEQQKLELLLDCLSDGSPTMLGYNYYDESGGTYGIAVVAYDVEYGVYEKNGTAYDGMVLIYDTAVADFNEDYCLYFNSTDGTWCVPAYEADSENGGSISLVTDDISVLNYNGYLEDAPEDMILYGDVDESGDLSIVDVIVLNKYLMLGEEISAQSQINADVDCNGIVNATDSLNILKAVVKIITLPVA